METDANDEIIVHAALATGHGPEKRSSERLGVDDEHQQYPAPGRGGQDGEGPAGGSFESLAVVGRDPMRCGQLLASHSGGLPAAPGRAIPLPSPEP